jgi:hypothetical protein
MRKTLDIIQACDSDQNLFVLCYAGHGRMNSARQAEWVFGQGPNSPFVDWSASYLPASENDVARLNPMLVDGPARRASVSESVGVISISSSPKLFSIL